MKRYGMVLGLLLLAGCESTGFAPILENARPDQKPSAVKPPPSTPDKSAASVLLIQKPGFHEVQKGDTLFAIAFQNGLDYRDLAFWNSLGSPDLIKLGQVLRLTAPDDRGRSRGVETLPLRETSLPSLKPIKDVPLFSEPKAQRLPYSEANWAMLTGATQAAETIKPATPPLVLPSTEKPVPALATEVASTTSAAQAQPTTVDNDDWCWPSEGNVLGEFGEGGGKGIDIFGVRLSPIVAAAPGKVVYSGTGLRGYGKMLIIKHQGEYLTAYAHNQNLLVKEGEWVKSGQKIAEMGDTDSERVKLHFEIRQFGKPLDPLKLLPERK